MELKHLPKIPGITQKTAKWLKLKSLWYLITHDDNKILSRYVLKHPLRYLPRLFHSLFRKKSYIRDGDFFLYNCKSTHLFKHQLKNPKALLVLGFSYCHKPFECPSKRFSSECIRDMQNPICSRCFIGKAVLQANHREVVPLFIPTVHYIGEKMFEIEKQYPDRKLLFLITACELTLEMFGDWGNMLAIAGIGVRLDGRICNTMKAFELSERGIKPGLTVVLNHTQERMLELIDHYNTYGKA